MDFTKMKGNLGLKSSALAPTACKLSSQFLVLDHMSNHYTKIAKAKSAIDSRPPKSLMTSQKMRDRMNRSRFAGSPQHRSHSSASGIVLSDYEDILKDEPEDEEEKLVHSIMRSTLLEKSRSSNNAKHGAESHMDPYQHQQMSTNIHETSPYGALIYNHPASVHSVRSGHSLTSTPSRMAIATNLLVKRTCKADVLEKRPHLFTEPERPFTPRTLKKNTESRLKNSKCYNPPHNKSAKKENNCEIDTDNNNKKDTFQNYEKDTVKNFEKGMIKNKKQQSKLRAALAQKEQSKLRAALPQKDIPQKLNEHQEYELETTAGTSKLSNSMLMDISLHSRDKTYNQEMSNGVPPLAITVDKDHMNWLQEQASKAEIRVRSSGRLKSSLHPDEDLHSVGRHHGFRESGDEPDVKMETLRKEAAGSQDVDFHLFDGVAPWTLDTAYALHFYGHQRCVGLYRSSASHRTPSSLWISQRLLEEDEEQKYLAFAKEVTDDVLSRGISSDSVLDKVFENHIVRRKDDLDEGRMRKVISDLRKNLGLEDSFSRGRASASLSDINYNRSRREHTTDSNYNRSRKEHTTDSNKAVREHTSDSNKAVREHTTDSNKAVREHTTDSNKAVREHTTDSNKAVREHTIDSNKAVREQITDNRSRDRHQTQFDSDVNSTLESVNTYTFGQTGDVLSTINSEASLERKEMDNKLGDDSEMAVSQTLRDYQLSLTDKEEIDDSVRESEHSVVKEDRPKQKPTTNERRIAAEGKLRAEVSSVSAQNCNSEKNHINNDEDTSIGSSVLSQQPVARPRTKARQGSQEGTQAEDDQVVHHAQRNVIHSSTASLDSNNTPAAGGSDTTDPGYTREHPSTTTRQETDHQQVDEVDEEYEDDYEEIIESENDSADDF